MTSTTPAPVHTLGPVVAFEASEPGALSGHAVTCSCGMVIRTSLSVAMARSDARRHVAVAEEMGF